MDHGAVIDNHTRRGWRIAMIAAMLGAIWMLPTSARAADATQPPAPPATTVGAKLVDPVDGKHLDHLELAPMVQFDPSTDASGQQENPRWVLLATDAGMKTTVRYCRQFVWAAVEGAFHWGCNRWATGVDQYGNDKLLALEAGKVYYWQVISRSSDGTKDIASAVRSFAIDAEGKTPSIADVSNKVMGTAYDDGSQLNLGAAALVNSGVRVSSIASSRLAPLAFRIRARHIGTADYSRSYLKISSAAGTRYMKVAGAGTGQVGTVWKLTPAERRLRTKRFRYQLFLKSTKNGAMVRSHVRVVLIRTTARPPAWKPD